MRRILGLVALCATVSALMVGAGSTPTIRQSAPVAGVTLAGLDAHDGTIVDGGAGTLYLYGTRYGCGYHWQQASSPFCGFGVWTSTTGLTGPWTYQGLLFDPNGINSTRNEPWRTTCNSGGNGCFNPRMVRRWDGVWVLYFNAPAETQRGQNNAYYVMGCNGPTGGCGSAAGAPYGSTRKLPLNACTASGDFSIYTEAEAAWIVCSTTTITVERLDYWWTTGTATSTAGAVRSIAYLSNVEAPGLVRMPDGRYVLTYSDPTCGYCSGTGTGYITNGTGPLGVWLGPAATGFNGPANGRRLISGTSCGGQPRTAFTVGGQPYEWIDTWQGVTDPTNQTAAGIRLEPLIPTGSYDHAADGSPWAGGFQPLLCQ